ncbi:MAG: biotin/lipoyl-binding protein [Ruminococcus sp.]|nr:biotin/lipoyl-binding protein [Ruminococcus sp.]
MKNLRITVNGTAYDVQVEELGADAVAAAPAPAPAKTAAPKAAPKATAGAGEKVAAPMPGTIVSVNVSNGQSVKAGDVLVVLEAMKMENEIKAPSDGTITSVVVAKGESVDTGATLVTIG